MGKSGKCFISEQHHQGGWRYRQYTTFVKLDVARGCALFFCMNFLLFGRKTEKGLSPGIARGRTAGSGGMNPRWCAQAFPEQKHLATGSRQALLAALLSMDGALVLAMGCRCLPDLRPALITDGIA